MAPTFLEELTVLINKYSLEGDSRTPDFVLASYLCQCLYTFGEATKARDKWHWPTEAKENAHNLDMKPTIREGL